MLTPPPTPPTIEESGHSQPESSTVGTSMTVPAYKPSASVHAPTEPILANVGVDSLWPHNIQHLVLALTRLNSLLDKPNLAILVTKNSLRLEDCRHLNEFETEKLFDNVMHFALESALYTYMGKKHNRVLRREFEV